MKQRKANWFRPGAHTGHKSHCATPTVPCTWGNTPAPADRALRLAF